MNMKPGPARAVPGKFLSRAFAWLAYAMVFGGTHAQTHRTTPQEALVTSPTRPSTQQCQPMPVPPDLNDLVPEFERGAPLGPFGYFVADGVVGGLAGGIKQTLTNTVWNGSSIKGRGELFENYTLSLLLQKMQQSPTQSMLFPEFQCLVSKVNASHSSKQPLNATVDETGVQNFYRDLRSKSDLQNLFDQSSILGAVESAKNNAAKSSSAPDPVATAKEISLSLIRNLAKSMFKDRAKVSCLQNNERDLNQLALMATKPLEDCFYGKATTPGQRNTILGAKTMGEVESCISNFSRYAGLTIGHLSTQLLVAQEYKTLAPQATREEIQELQRGVGQSFSVCYQKRAIETPKEDETLRVTSCATRSSALMIHRLAISQINQESKGSVNPYDVLKALENETGIDSCPLKTTISNPFTADAAGRSFDPYSPKTPPTNLPIAGACERYQQSKSDSSPSSLDGLRSTYLECGERIGIIAGQMLGEATIRNTPAILQMYGGDRKAIDKLVTHFTTNIYDKCQTYLLGSDRPVDPVTGSFAPRNPKACLEFIESEITARVLEDTLAAQYLKLLEGAGYMPRSQVARSFPSLADEHATAFKQCISRTRTQPQFARHQMLNTKEVKACFSQGIASFLPKLAILQLKSPLMGVGAEAANNPRLQDAIQNASVRCVGEALEGLEKTTDLGSRIKSLEFICQTRIKDAAAPILADLSITPLFQENGAPGDGERFLKGDAARIIAETQKKMADALQSGRVQIKNQEELIKGLETELSQARDIQVISAIRKRVETEQNRLQELVRSSLSATDEILFRMQQQITVSAFERIARYQIKENAPPERQEALIARHTRPLDQDLADAMLDAQRRDQGGDPSLQKQATEQRGIASLQVAHNGTLLGWAQDEAVNQLGADLIRDRLTKELTENASWVTTSDRNRIIDQFISQYQNCEKGYQQSVREWKSALNQNPDLTKPQSTCTKQVTGSASSHIYKLVATKAINDIRDAIRVKDPNKAAMVHSNLSWTFLNDRVLESIRVGPLNGEPLTALHEQQRELVRQIAPLQIRLELEQNLGTLVNSDSAIMNNPSIAFNRCLDGVSAKLDAAAFKAAIDRCLRSFVTGATLLAANRIFIEVLNTTSLNANQLKNLREDLEKSLSERLSAITLSPMNPAFAAHVSAATQVSILEQTLKLGKILDRDQLKNYDPGKLASKPIRDLVLVTHGLAQAKDLIGTLDDEAAYQTKIDGMIRDLRVAHRSDPTLNSQALNSLLFKSPVAPYILTGMIRKQATDEIKAALTEMSPRNPKAHVISTFALSPKQIQSQFFDDPKGAEIIQSALDRLVNEPNYNPATDPRFNTQVRNHLAQSLDDYSLTWWMFKFFAEDQYQAELDDPINRRALALGNALNLTVPRNFFNEAINTPSGQAALKLMRDRAIIPIVVNDRKLTNAEMTALTKEIEALLTKASTETPNQKRN